MCFSFLLVVHGIKRWEISRLLDQIEDDNGPVMADHVLALLRRPMSWHASRGDDFPLPHRARHGQNEAEGPGAAPNSGGSRTEGRLDGCRDVSRPRYLLLTATRLLEAAKMARSEVSAEFTVPAARATSPSVTSWCRFCCKIRSDI
jgi:hypothetical protein